MPDLIEMKHLKQVGLLNQEFKDPVEFNVEGDYLTFRTKPRAMSEVESEVKKCLNGFEIKTDILSKKTKKFRKNSNTRYKKKFEEEKQEIDLESRFFKFLRMLKIGHGVDLIQMFKIK